MAMDEKLSWHTGLLVGTLAKAGITAAPRIDTGGNYTEEIEIVVEFPSAMGGKIKEKIAVRVIR